MVYRALCAAVLLACAAGSAAQAQRATTLENPAPPKPDATQTSSVKPGDVRATASSPALEKLATMKGTGVAQASISKTCKGGDGKTHTYTVSVKGGSCIQFMGSIACRNDKGDTAEADCATGCSSTTGDGSCTDVAR